MVDAAAVTVIAPLLVVTSFDITTDVTSGPVTPWVVAVVLPLVLRRRLPVTSAVAVFVVAAVQTVVGPALLMPADLAVLVSLYTVTVYGPAWAGRAAMSGIVAGASAFVARSAVDGQLPFGLSASFAIVISGLAVWALAMLRRARRDTLDALHDRAERLERERDQQALIAVAAERARIAREMHDVVAHSLSVVVAQADGGRYAIENDPSVAGPVLATIADTGRSALTDVRRILGVLRDGPPDGTAADSRSVPTRTAGTHPSGRQELVPDAPQPSDGDVAALVEGIRRAGLEVSVEEVGTPVAVTAGLQLTAYRVLQEALTNVLRHAGPDATARVVRRWNAERLVIEVTDDGRGASSTQLSAGSGLGLPGMAERVGLFDGELDAGPADGGGFRVRVELPLTTAIPQTAPSGGPL
ncbi:MAG: hypothetical protein JJT89_04265 [Nitriliruptoraceae bacterium]|nr:hypothetical protein [Nitriliruptoraceae bacterium]